MSGWTFELSLLPSVLSTNVVYSIYSDHWNSPSNINYISLWCISSIDVYTDSWSLPVPDPSLPDWRNKLYLALYIWIHTTPSSRYAASRILGNPSSSSGSDLNSHYEHSCNTGSSSGSSEVECHLYHIYSELYARQYHKLNSWKF